MASTLARAAGVRDFYLEVCRCLPFIQRLHKLEEIASLRELRAVVKSKFNEFKGAQDPRVVDLLIFKGREELECYLMMHKQRHHAITEYIEPYSQRAQKAADVQSLGTSFMSSFLETPYPQIPRKL